MARNDPRAGVPAETSASGVSERTVDGLGGLPVLGLSLLLVLGGAALLTSSIDTTASRVVGTMLIVLGAAGVSGLTQVVPGEARVVQLFGRYTATVRRSGLRWVNPFARRRRVSVRIRNHESAVAKVNDADGNPIEIAAVVVWQVEDTAMALYAVDDFQTFVAIQTETAVRHIASAYPYTSHREGELSLRENAAEITAKLSAEIGERVAPAG